MNNVWILGGDPAVCQTALIRALRVLDAMVEMVPIGQGVRFWNRPMPKVLIFGASATNPMHPLIVRASRSEGTSTVLVTTKRTLTRIGGGCRHLALPASVTEVVGNLQSAFAIEGAPPIRLAS